MGAVLANAVTDLLQREPAKIVAGTGILFEALARRYPQRTVADVLESQRGGVWGEEGAEGCGYPVLRSTNMRGSKADVSDVASREIPTKQAEACALRTGDILVTKSSGSSDLVGKSVLFIHPGDGRTYLFSNFTLRLRPIAKIISPSFLAWFLRSPQALGWRYATQQNAVGLRNLQTDQFLSQHIPMPPLPIQEAVANYLDSLEVGRDLSAVLPSELAEQQRMVGRVEKLAAKIAECQRLREESLKASASIVVSLHISLSGKRTVSLRNILTLDERRSPVFPEGKYPQVGIRGFGGGLFARGALDGTQTTYKEFNRLFDGALVLSQVKGWEGAIAVCDEQFAGWYASPEYRTFSFIPEEALATYMSAIVSSPWFYNKLTDLTRGVGARRERTRPEAFLEMKIPMPTVQQQRSALRVLKKLGALKKIQSETSVELDALMPSILSKAFRGEL